MGGLTGAPPADSDDFALGIFSFSTKTLIKPRLLVPPQKLVKIWSVIPLASSADNVDFVELPAVYQLLRPRKCQFSIRVPSRYDLPT